MQAVRKEAKCFSGALQAALETNQSLLHLQALNVAAFLSQVADIDRDTCQFLADAVVQIARDARPLGFLSCDQPAGEIAVLLVTGSKGSVVGDQDLFDAAASGPLH